MTYSISIGGSMQDLGDEAVIEDLAKELVDNLNGVTYANLVTTHGGNVNLMSESPSTSGDPGDEQPESSSTAANDETVVDEDAASGDAPGENGAPGDYADSQTAEATDPAFDLQGTQPPDESETSPE